MFFGKVFGQLKIHCTSMKTANEPMAISYHIFQRPSEDRIRLKFRGATAELNSNYEDGCAPEPTKNIAANTEKSVSAGTFWSDTSLIPETFCAQLKITERTIDATSVVRRHANASSSEFVGMQCANATPRLAK